MITYRIGESLYINLTNKCSNNCCFCIRNTSEGVGYDLWLDKEPSAEHIIEDIGDPTAYSEIVFCGYGEPLTKLYEIIEVSRFVKQSGVRVRVNTNGQANLIYGRNIVPELKGLVDAISISLNAKNAEQYNKLCNPEYGEASYQAIIDFTQQCKKYIDEVVLTVVDIISAHDVEQCRRIAEELGVGFRVRHYY